MSEDLSPDSNKTPSRFTTVDPKSGSSGGLSLSLEGMDTPKKEAAPAEAAPAPAAPAPKKEEAPALSMESKPAPKPAASTPAPATPKSEGGGEEGSTKGGKRIGDRLLELGLITEDQLNVALHEKKKSGKMVGETLVELGFINEDILTQFLSESSGHQQFDPKKVMLDPDALAVVEKKEALKHRLLPVSIDKNANQITIAMADPDDVVALDRLRQLLPRGMDVVTQICPPAIITDAIHRAYGASTSIEGILKELAGDKAAAKKNIDSLSEEESYSHPLVRLVNAVIIEAVKMGASDLHFEPEENFVRVRYRIDGDLMVAHIFHREYWTGICQRLKIMAELNIADKLSPQDGRFSLSVGGRDADFRVASLPTVFGENIVLRVLDKNASIVPMEKLGFSDHNTAIIKKILARPEGIIIVTGPTGSGKTTTLYSMLNAINTLDVNIMTLEDPVEYSLGIIRQSSVRDGTGLSFADGVKALLRQDPDIIFVGEVRDEPTAQQALKAAMTGHQVFTTLHTNDSFGTIPRLVDLGLKPAMLAGAIVACFAQRLVRKICPHCKEGYTASPEECRLMAVDSATPPTLYRGKGCKECGQAGNKGRMGIHEILYVDEELDMLVATGSTKAQLKACAVKNGFRSMLDDGILKVQQGVISLEELGKVANMAERM